MSVPSDFPGLKFWIDAAQITGLSNGDPVASWSDLSGNAHHVSQATPSSRPAYRTAQFGALPAVEFDGSDDSLSTGSPTAVDLPGVFSIFAVVRFTTTAKGPSAQNTVLSKHYTRYEVTEYEGRQAAYFGGSTFNAPASHLSASRPILLEWHRRPSDSWTVALEDGIPSAGGVHAAGASGTHPLTIGARPGGGPSLHLHGVIAEVAIFDTYLVDADRHDLRRSLASKWGTPDYDYPLPIRPDAAKPILPPQPATITVPESGLIAVRHYLGDSARHDIDRLWVQLPSAYAQEVTSGSVTAWPGVEARFPVTAGQEIRVAINGASGTSASSAANPSPTFANTGNNARTHEVDDFETLGEWARYVEWENLVLAPSPNGRYNDSRTLIYYPASVPALTVGYLTLN